nr:salutaridinol 7-O-acetyltransferase-like [Coffea arabica]
MGELIQDLHSREDGLTEGPEGCPQGHYDGQVSFPVSKVHGKQSNGHVYSFPSSGIAGSRSIHLSVNQKTAYMDIEIISKEEIKPASPTPPELRTFRFSILDQLTRDSYTNILFFFFPRKQRGTYLNDVISQRSRCLKESLSKTLVPFYPLAGKIKDNLHIACNDDGVYYVETQTNIGLLDFLRKPENEFMNQLCPFHPDSTELLSKSYPIMVQVNIFYCSGIAICLSASHKIFDGLSVSTFMQSWAATARESTVQINPSFISSSLFPPILDMYQDSPPVVSKPQKNEPKYATSRFVFDSSALAALKSKAAISTSSAKPSSAKAVMGLLWKSAIAAWKVRSVLFIPVNLRTKVSPPLSPHSLGNIVWLARAKCCDNPKLELELLINKISNSIGTMNADFVESINGENGIQKLMGALKDFHEVFYDPNSMAECIYISSIRKTGFYEADFGWGKPIWTCIARGNRDLHGLGNIAHLIETKSGDGIEALVTMKEEYM